MALGYNLILPTTDRYNETKTRLLSMIAYAMGGRAAEEVVYK
jgi:cell division protease FtsH